MTERPTFRIRGAQSLTDAADKVRSGAPLSVGGRPAPTVRKVSTSAKATTFCGNTAERVLVKRDGGHRTHQVREATARNRARSATGRKLVAIDTPDRPTRLPIGGRIPNTSGWSNDAARGNFAAYDRPSNKRNGR